MRIPRESSRDVWLGPVAMVITLHPLASRISRILGALNEVEKH